MCVYKFGEDDEDDENDDNSCGVGGCKEEAKSGLIFRHQLQN